MIGTVNQPYLGNLATLGTKTKTTVVAAVNDALYGNRAGAAFHGRGGVTWNATTKVFTIAQPSYILHGTDGNYLSFTSDIVADFSAVAVNQIVYLYVHDVTPTAIQSGHSVASYVKQEAYTDLTHNLWDPDICVLAIYTQSDNKLQSPFFANGDLADDRANRAGMIYEARGGANWNPSTKILTLTPNTYIYPGRDGVYLSFEDAVTLDFSSFASNYVAYAYVVGVDVNTIQDDYSNTNILVESVYDLTHKLSDPDVYLLATYIESTNQIISPFFADGTPPDQSQTSAQTWTNLYPQLLSKLSGFAAKMLHPADDVKIVLWGDSLMARDEFTSAGSITPSELPPMLLTRNLAWYIWDNLPMRKATYKRYDVAAYFTETGVWATSLSGDNTANGGADTNWDDEGDRSAYTRISDSATAAVAWTLGITDDESGCNLIFRTDTAGDSAATITVAEGNGYLEYWNGSSWAEANAATFSMRETDEGARRGNTIYNKRLKLRKATAHENDSVTVSVGKATADADRLLFWGVELYDEINGKFIPQLVNSARGAHYLNTSPPSIYDYMDDDVLDQNPDLVVFEIPLLNMIIEAGATFTGILNSVQDVIWGDRGGATNTWNLKTISNGWADFQVLLIIPHHSQVHYDSGSAYTELVAGVDCREIYNAVKSLIVSHGDVAMIDMATAFERTIDVGAYAGDYYAAVGGSGTTGETYTHDDIHQNDLGTLIYARHICPVLDFTSV